MTKDKLYRLMDVLEEIKQVDGVLSVHTKSATGESSSLMMNQYKAKKEKLLVYFINEINSSSEHRPYRLRIIKEIMERFYSTAIPNKSIPFKEDDRLSKLVKAISA